MRIYMLRHGATAGNLQGRYVGTTDEALTTEAAKQLQEYGQDFRRQMASVQLIYSSPLLRCRQTAEILFPDREIQLVEDFRECDFGSFEYHNYAELNGQPEYQRFIDTMGDSGFPQGEKPDVFRRRCVEAMKRVLTFLEETHCEEDIGLVVHGGTIMALLDYFSRPHKGYYDWQTANATGYGMERKREGEQWYFSDIYRFEICESRDRIQVEQL